MIRVGLSINAIAGSASLGEQALEPQIHGGEAELGAAKEDCRLFSIIARVRPYGMHIAEGPLDWVVGKDGLSATGFKQAIHSLDTPRDRLRRIPPCARALRQWELLPGAQQVHQCGKGVE